MPVVFVHGETAAVWEPLLVELERAGLPRAEMIRLSGFGVPLPDGFWRSVDRRAEGGREAEPAPSGAPS